MNLFHRFFGSRGGLRLAAAALLATASGAPALELKSPDGLLTVTFEVKSVGTAPGCPCYRVDWNGRPVIVESRLGLALDGAALLEGFAVVRSSSCESNTTWRPVCGERAEIRDHFRQLTVELQQTNAARRALLLTFRAYDEGAAFCYTLPRQAGMEAVKIAREASEFRFGADAPAWAVYSAQGVYRRVPLSAVKPGCERPLVVELADDLFAAVAEARLVDYARMKFAPLPGAPHSLVSLLDGPVEGRLPLTSPRRVIMAAASAGRLLENNGIIPNLNDPCALEDTSWIKPGKVIREVTLTTQGGRACVDFAVKRGLQYVEYDAGWYGPENNDASDARGVHVDPQRSKGPLDLREVIRYAGERGVGIILYVNHCALERQLDELLPIYQSWGVKGMKFGFVNVGPQQWTAWLHEAVRKCARYRMMVDIHDEYRTSGYSRTYPNLMTVEGIHGDECKPLNTETLAFAFTRFLAGPADNTVCYYDARVDANASHAYQLAKPVCLFSPWQFLFWYDRPPASPARAGGAGGAETQIGDDPELEFYNRMPTTWDETRVLQGRIGEYAVVARRRGDDWFIGFMNSGQERTFDAPLDFLPAGGAYDAWLYTDDPATPGRTHVRIDRRRVDRASVLALQAGAHGGVAVRLHPEAR